MFQNIKRKLKYLFYVNQENTLLALGCLLANQQLMMNSQTLNDYEFKIFSQHGEDGIIQYLIRHIERLGGGINKTFIEFGVEDYRESNTRFLMMNNNWAGFVIDGSPYNMRTLRSQNWFWKYNLQCKAAFIDKDNINALMESSGLQNIGLLSIDIDGNDYHILRAMDFKKLNPAILICEYNALFGKEAAISVPYAKDFYRTNTHYSNLFYGASLKALNIAAEEKGYSFVGCNLAGNNAFFVRNDLIKYPIRKISVNDGFCDSNFREARCPDGSLFCKSDDFKNLSKMDYLLSAGVENLQVLNVETGIVEVFCK
jgi:hypothetical protein